MDGTAQAARGTHEGAPLLLLRAGESRGAQPLWQGSGGVPQRSLFLLLHAGGVQRGTAALAGVWGCPPEIFISTTTCGGSPEGHSRFGRGLGDTPRDPLFLLLHAGGVQRGTAALAGVWGTPPEIFYFFPLPSRKGARGMVRATIETTRSEAEVLHATPPQIATSQPPRNDPGVVTRRGFDIRHSMSYASFHKCC